MKRLQSISYKTLFAILFFSLAGIVFFLKIGGKTQKVSAAWWDDMWHYRKAISIGNTSGSILTNQRVKITIDTTALVTAGKLQSDCDDIRITDINGNLLDHWDTGCNTSTTNIYAKTSSLSTSGSTIYFYYGNSSANNIEKPLGTSENPGTSCKMMKDQGSVTTSGLYYVTPGGNDSDKIQVYCNTDIISDAWTLVINNGAYTIPPKPTWTNAIDTVNITGTISDNLDSFDLLLGLKHWNYLGNTALIQMGSDPNTITKRAHYSSFSLNTSNNYALTLSGQTIDLGGTAPGFYSSHNGQQFTTYDADHDTYVTNCSTNYSNTPWWYHSCWSGSIWGGGDGGGYQNKPYWLSSITDYYNYGGIYISGTDSMKNITVDSPSTEEIGGGPIAYWKFDEGVGTTVYDSAGANNGTLGTGNSAPTWADESQCISGKCLKFDGVSDYINIGTSNIISGTTYTVEAWFKTQDVSKNQDIFAQRNSSNSNSIMGQLYITSSKIAFITRNDSGGNSALAQGSTTLINNTWYHAVGVRSGSNVYIYLNGKLEGSDNDAGGTITSNTNDIGRANYGGTYVDYLNSYIDDIKIYPYARTADQVKLDYNSRGSMSGSSANLGIKSNTAPSLKSSLVAYYKFDENSGTTAHDSSGNNLNGTLQSGTSIPTWSNEGKINKSLNFLGNDYSYVSVSDITNSPLDLTNEFTVSGWVNVKNFNSYDSLIYKFGTYAILPWGDRHIRFYANDGSWSNKITSNQTIQTNKWTYISITYSVTNSKLKLFIDGKLDNEVTVSNPLTTNNDPLYIGKGYTSENGNMNGLIDEVKIYNRALTADEIKQDYNQGSAISFGSTTQNIGGTTTSLDYCIPGDTSTCSAPVAEWNFEENSGTTIKDTGGNNFNGIFSTGTYAPDWTTGKNNQGAGINFNGESNSSYIGTSFPSTLPTSYTAEVWINPKITTCASSSYGCTIMAASGPSASQYPIWLTLKNGEIRLAAFSDSSIVFHQTSGAGIQANKWYHIAASATKSGTATIYVNGIGLTSFTSGNNSWVSTDKLTFGDLRPARNISFSGKMDDIKFYDYIRTPAQIAYDYNKGAPVGWWKLDECQGSVINDSSGNGNTGNLSIGQSGTQNSIGTCQIGTSASWTNGASGKINSSINFDGSDDYITINDSPNIRFNTNDFSITAWVKHASNLNSIHRGIFTKGNTSTGGFSLYINYDTRKLRFINQNSITIDSNQIIADNSWHHVVASRNSNDLILYVDGKLDNSSPGYFSDLNLNNSATALIGLRDGNRYFNGQIDDIRIYNYALTDEQVKTVYNNGAVNFN